MEETSIAVIISSAQSIFDFVITNLATLVTTIMANPILFIPLLLTLVGLVIGVFGRLSNR